MRQKAAREAWLAQVVAGVVGRLKPCEVTPFEAAVEPPTTD